MTGFDADTIVTGAHVVTMDPRRPHATAFAVRDGRFLAVGDDDLVRELRGPRTVVRDLGGAAVTPDSSTRTCIPFRASS